jgi:pyruvate/2-oxoglutarate dehydrogenase complex dihydrolipoamide acyltransferase (E2) component
MARYSNLNSYFLDGFVKKHESVVAGLAIDEGGRLVVYGIENAMRLGLSDVRSEILNAVSRYMEHALTDSEMSRATFTVTDLSAEPLDFIFPLLPERQSCIIGITRDTHGEFRLYVGFDHRVTEGREVALFLGELRSRLQSFDTGTRASNTRCCFCKKSLAEGVRSLKNRGLIKVLNAEGNEVYCCLACLGGC